MIFLFCVMICFLAGCQEKTTPPPQPSTEENHILPENADTIEPETPQVSEPMAQTPQPAPPTAPHLAPPIQQSFAYLQKKPMADTITPTTPQKPEKPEPITENKLFWQSENTLQWNNLKSVATAAQHAYNDLGKKLCWISKNGKLYAYYAQKIITTDDLVSAGYLESGLPSSDYEILLLNGNDVMYYPGAQVPPESMKFCIFVAFHQSDGNYLLGSTAGKAGILSSASFNSLMNRYNQNHNLIGRLSSTSAEYSRILNFVGLYEGKLEDYFVREIYKDDMYAVVTFSNKQNTTDIKQHILRNDNNFWEVVYTNLQNVYSPITSINQALPDFNLALLPDYTLSSWKSYLKKSDSNLIKTLLDKKIITDENQIYYQCGTSDYFYIVLKNGSRYVAYYIEGAWQITHVNSDYEAKNFIAKRTGADYGFLILDD